MQRKLGYVKFKSAPKERAETALSDYLGFPVSTTETAGDPQCPYMDSSSFPAVQAMKFTRAAQRRLATLLGQSRPNR